MSGNFSIANSMPNLVIDPTFMCTTKPPEATNGTNPEDYYESLREYYKSSFFPFSNDMLKDLVSQIDIYIQMLLQTLLAAKDTSQQYQLYILLYDFTRRKESILNSLNLPKFEVPWVYPKKSGGERGEPLQIHPQVSFYQAPVLEYASEIITMIGK